MSRFTHLGTKVEDFANLKRTGQGFDKTAKTEMAENTGSDQQSQDIGGLPKWTKKQQKRRKTAKKAKKGEKGQK